MMEFGIGFGAATLIGAIVALIVWAFKRDGGEVEVETFDAHEEALTMTAEEKEEIIRDYAGDNVPFEISEDISGAVSEFSVTHIDAYGTRYQSIHEAGMHCMDLTREEHDALLMMEASLDMIRRERMSSRRYLEVRELLDEKIYIYEPCKMSLDVASRKGQPARMGIAIKRDKDLKMIIDYVYVSKSDITRITDRYEFDMTNPDDTESFNMLVRGGSNQFSEELKELDTIHDRLTRFNELVSYNRVEIEENGHVIIYPPTPDEIKAKRARLREQNLGPTESKQASPVKAKADVDQEFVSSAQL